MSERLKASLSFQTRITAAAMGTTICVLLLACGLFALEQYSVDRARAGFAQKIAAEKLAPRLAEAVAAGDLPRAERVIGDAGILSRLARAELLDARGKVLVRFRAPQGKTAGETVELRRPVPAPGGGEVLRLVSAVEPLSSVLPRYLGLTGALFFAATGCSLFLGRLLARRVIEPVDRLSRVMGEVAVSGDLRRRVEVTHDDEFGRLIRSFNVLLDRLQSNEAELRRTLDELVVARDQAEAANVQKSHFLANMSHEIRTPLNGVLAMAQIMALGELGEEQRSRLDVIRNSGQALLTILNDILDVSKIEAGALVLETVAFDLRALIEATVGGFSAVADGKGIALEVAWEGPVEPQRLGDPARLRQILANLVSNALKFTEAGRVEVRVEALAEGEGVRMRVSDTGIGMPGDKLSLLFQKFTQLDSSTTRKFGGTGLGLAICSELSAMMGGRIWAESVEGSGSTFTVELPLPLAQAAPAAEPEGAVEAPGADRPLRVLAAEDNKTNQLVLTTILEMFGVELVIVENGREAVEAAAGQAWDVILMDIQMPVMDGIAAAVEIRRQEAASGRARVPIVAVSANAMAHQVREYLAAGMDGHVAKPIEIAHLQAALERALEPEPAAEAPAAHAAAGAAA